MILNKKRIKLISSALIITATVVAVALLSPTVKADQFDAQIAALKDKVKIATDSASVKSAEASTLKGKITAIDAEIAAAQQLLDLTNLEVKRTQANIDQATREMEVQKDILRNNLRMIYKTGDITPLEVIASSKNLSDFVAQQQYLTAIKRKVDGNLVKIDELKNLLDTKKAQLGAQSTQQKSTVDQIAAKRAEQQSLLARTQGEESNYNRVIGEDNNKIASLKRQQAAIISSFSRNVRTGGSGGYPWANAPYGTYDADDWGFYLRQCTSYTAWKVAASGRRMPKWGEMYIPANAKQWPGIARANSIPVDGNPRVGDVAISSVGEWGHTMYVESIDWVNNTVHVSQYNFNFTGNYSTSDVDIAGLEFIHF